MSNMYATVGTKATLVVVVVGTADPLLRSLRSSHRACI